MSRVDPTVAIAMLLAQCDRERRSASFALERREVDDPDIIVADYGTIFLFYPRSQAAHEWWQDRVERGAMNLGRNFVVEHRFVQDTLKGLRRVGFVPVNGRGEHA